MTDREEMARRRLIDADAEQNDRFEHGPYGRYSAFMFSRFWKPLMANGPLMKFGWFRVLYARLCVVYPLFPVPGTEGAARYAAHCFALFHRRAIHTIVESLPFVIGVAALVRRRSGLCLLVQYMYSACILSVISFIRLWQARRAARLSTVGDPFWSLDEQSTN